MSAEPTTDEVIAMWVDLIHLSAFQLIHGAEGGYRRFRYLRFGTPESESVPPEALRMEWPIYRRTPDEADEASPGEGYRPDSPHDLAATLVPDEVDGSTPDEVDGGKS